MTIQLTPDPAFRDVLRLLGYKQEKTKIREDLAARIKKYYEEFKAGLVAEGRYLLSGCHETGERRYRLENGLIITGRTATRVLAEADLAILGLVTLGRKFDMQWHALTSRGLGLEGVVMDAVGSAAIEDAVGQLHDRIRAQLTMVGKYMSGRVSPGYGDLDLRLQGPLLTLLDGAGLGIELTESNMLDPNKTITFLAGAADRCNPRWRDLDCDDCGRKDCGFRG